MYLNKYPIVPEKNVYEHLKKAYPAMVCNVERLRINDKVNRVTRGYSYSLQDFVEVAVHRSSDPIHVFYATGEKRDVLYELFKGTFFVDLSLQQKKDPDLNYDIDEVFDCIMAFNPKTVMVQFCRPLQEEGFYTKELGSLRLPKMSFTKAIVSTLKKMKIDVVYENGCLYSGNKLFGKVLSMKLNEDYGYESIFLIESVDPDYFKLAYEHELIMDLIINYKKPDGTISKDLILSGLDDIKEKFDLNYFWNTLFDLLSFGEDIDTPVTGIL